MAEIPDGEEPTGFEHRILKDIIVNWLYYDKNPDLQSRVAFDAERELRKRFAKVFPRPTWIGGSGG